MPDTSLLSFHRFREDYRSERMKSILASPGIVLFFKKGGMVYGAPEDSRVLFARMRSRDDEDDAEWKKNASFTAFNLSSTLDSGHLSQSVFQNADLGDIEVIDREEAARLLDRKEKSRG